MDSCWVISDGAAGNRNQALALAHGLGLSARVFDITLTAPWSWLAPFAPRDPRRALATLPAGFTPPWPSLAIGCGRASAGIVLGLKQLSRGHTRAVQILDPRWRRAQFDALVIPAHDEVSGDNVIPSIGSLNRIDDAWLAEGRARFPALGQLPSPRTAVLIGGPVADVPLDDDYVDGLLNCLSAWQARDGGSVLVTCSRRTPALLAQRLREVFAAWPGLFWASDNDGANPYPGILAWADRIVVTPDSSNLLGEASAVGVPVYAHLPPTLALQRKRQHLVKHLRDRGHLHALHPTAPSVSDVPPPLRDLPRITAAVRARLRPPPLL